jgi:hypothetical protein
MKVRDLIRKIEAMAGGMCGLVEVIASSIIPRSAAWLRFLASLTMNWRPEL